MGFLGLRVSLIGLCVGVPTLASHAQDANALSDAGIAALQVACSSTFDCQIAADELIAKLMTAAPAGDISTVIVAIVMDVAAAYNAGHMAAPAALVILETMAVAANTTGPLELPCSIEEASAAVRAGDPIDWCAATSGDGSASPG